MRILFLDDDLNRHSELDRVIGEKYYVKHVYTAEGAIDALKLDTYDLVMLDHDLGLSHDPDGLDVELGPDGRVVVNWMIGHYADPATRPPVIVHSWNSVRGPEMELMLREAGFSARWASFHKEMLRRI